MSWIEKLLPPRIKGGSARQAVPAGLWIKCPACAALLSGQPGAGEGIDLVARPAAREVVAVGGVVARAGAAGHLDFGAIVQLRNARHGEHVGDGHAEQRDMSRLFSELKGDDALFRMAIAYVLTMPRIPQLYYGTEIQMPSSTGARDDASYRHDFPGGWAGDKVNAFTGAGLTGQQRGASRAFDP
eukprot:gene28831-32561_t